MTCMEKKLCDKEFFHKREYKKDCDEIIFVEKTVLMHTQRNILDASRTLGLRIFLFVSCY